MLGMSWSKDSLAALEGLSLPLALTGACGPGDFYSVEVTWIIRSITGLL